MPASTATSRGTAARPTGSPAPKVVHYDRVGWTTIPDTAARQAICRDIQVQCMDDLPFFPLGQYAVTTAYRGITGVLKGFPTFWSVRPA